MYERSDDKEGMGCIAWTGVCLIALVVAIAMTCCGCEDDGDTTIIYEAQDINIPTNSTTPVIIAGGNSGDTDIKVTQVDEAAGEGESLSCPSIIATDNEGNTSISVTQTSKPAPPPEPVP